MIEDHTSSPLPTHVSFEQVVEQYADFVWRTLRRLGVRDADVDDTCQEVFVVVSRKLAELRDADALRSWLYGICVRVAAAHRRRAAVRREIPSELADEAEASGGGPDSDLRRKQELAHLDKALDSLDEDKRAVFVLYEIEELSMSEVAEIVGCPLQTAYSRHRVARERVLAAFRREERS